MKKIISLILTVILTLSAASINISAESWLSENEIGLLKALDIIDDNVNYNEVVTRGKFSTLASSIISLEDLGEYDKVYYNDVKTTHKDFKGITRLAEMCIVSPAVNFRPDDNITIEEMSKILVKILGYDYLYKNSWFAIASEMKLFKDVNCSNDEILMSQALKIIYNTLQCDISKSNYYDGIADGGGKDIYIEKRLSVFKVKGIVSDDGDTALIGKSTVKKGYLKVDDLIIKNQINEENLLGYEIVGYYVEDKAADENQLLFAEKTKKNSVVTAIDERIDSFNKNTRTYLYTEDEFTTTKKRAGLSSDVSVIYNNEALVDASNFTNDMFVPKNGSVTLIDNNDDGKYEVLFIHSYETVVYSAYDDSRSIIYGKGGTSFTYNDESIIKTAEGKDINVSDITTNSILLVEESLTKDMLRITVSSATASGTITQISKEGNKEKYVFTSEGGKYKIAESISALGVELKAGAAYNFFIDSLGRVAYATKATDGAWIAGVVVNIWQDEGMGDYGMRIYEETDESSVYSCAEKVKIYKDDATEVSGKNVIESISSYRGLIRFKINSEGYITEIEMPLKYGMNTDSEDRLYTVFETTDDSTASNYCNNYPYKTTSRTMGGIMVLDNTTKIFNIPEETERTSDYSVTKYDSLANDKTYVFKGYGTDSDSALCQYMSIVRKAETVIGQETYPFVVTGISIVVNDDDVVCTEIKGFTKNTAKSIYVEEGSDVLNKIQDPMSTEGVYYTLKKGDIIRYSEKNNFVNKIEMVYSANGVNPIYPNSRLGWLAGSTGLIESGVLNGNPYAIRDQKLQSDYLSYSSGYPRFMFGWIYKAKDGVLTMTTQNLENEAYDPAGDNGKYITTSYRLDSNTIVATYDGKNVTAGTGNIGDIKTYKDYKENCSRVLVLTASGEPRGIVIINGSVD